VPSAFGARTTRDSPKILLASHIHLCRVNKRTLRTTPNLKGNQMIDPKILQPIFDKVATHFLAMPKPSVTGDNALCLYRDEEDGNRCFIGALIQDEDYDPRIEGRAIRGYASTKNSANSTLETAVVRGLNAMGIEIDELSDDLIDDLNNLQIIHDAWGDGSCTKETARNRLIEFAKQRNLSDAALTAEVAA